MLYGDQAGGSQLGEVCAHRWRGDLCPASELAGGELVGLG